MVDPWNLYNRECVSYVAWALEKRFNKKVNPFRGDGNATDWPVSAVTWSGAMRVYSPQRGDVVVLPASGSFASNETTVPHPSFQPFFWRENGPRCKWHSDWRLLPLPGKKRRKGG